jgi:hypothetical protein
LRTGVKNLFGIEGIDKFANLDLSFETYSPGNPHLPELDPKPIY